MTVTAAGSNPQPQDAIHEETVQHFRDNPSDNFQFRTALNTMELRRLACFKRKANLYVEAQPDGNTPTAWTAVIWKDRQCPKWSEWEPGISPREQVAEERARKFTLDIKSIDTRLTMLAIRVTIVIGALQLLLMTPDSIGGWLWKKLVGWCTCGHP